MPTIERLLLAYVVNAAWTTCVVAAVAALLSRWTRQGPSVNRHILWVVALALASLLPLATLRNSTGRNLAASSSARGEMNASPSTGRPSSSLHSVWFVMRHGGALIPTAPFSAGLLSTFYVAFLCYRGTRLWWLWRRTKQILRRASSCAIPSSTAAVVQRCCAAFGVARVTILTSGEIAGPVALGVRHPILVFPEWFFSKVTEEEVVCSMCH